MKLNTFIEICEMPEGELAGRTKIKMSALEIHPDENSWNKNGITWMKQYIEDNMASAIGMPYVVSWLDEENQIPSDHGMMSVDEEGNIEFEGVAVGTVQDAYIGQVDVDGESKDALITEGYLFSQRYPKFVQWLKDNLSEGNNIKGSIEINGKGTNKNIVYLNGSSNEDGTLKMGRIPTEFDFSGLAILYLCNPSDNTSQVIEVNKSNAPDEVNENLKKEKVVVKSKSFELNELSYDDIATIISRAFNSAMSLKEPNVYHYYYIYKFYPQSQTVIMIDWDTPSEYYKTTYTITNNDVTIGDIIEVDMAWTPSNDESAVEVNTSLIKDILTKNMNKGGTMMDEKQIQELNSKVEELTSKVAELNNTVVEANKALEAKNNEVTTITEELNSLKAFKEEKDTEAKQAEINTYFENEVSKNGFTEVELNTLKTEYVDKMDMVGLKSAEAELCVKKVKELNTLQRQSELNTVDNGDLFMTIHNTEKSEADISDLF